MMVCWLRIGLLVLNGIAEADSKAGLEDELVGNAAACHGDVSG
jgi:hypothetical protein